MSLEQRVSDLERRVARIEVRLSRLESQIPSEFDTLMRESWLYFWILFTLIMVRNVLLVVL